MALIVLGVLALAYQGITYTTHEKVVEVGPLTATVEKEKKICRRSSAHWRLPLGWRWSSSELESHGGDSPDWPERSSSGRRDLRPRERPSSPGPVAVVTLAGEESLSKVRSARHCGVMLTTHA